MRARTIKPFRVRMQYTTLMDFGIVKAITKEGAIEQAEDMLANNEKVVEELSDPEWRLYIKSKKYPKVK